MIIEKKWPVEDTEHVLICPMCESEQRTLIHTKVKDWTFFCSPGAWDYWRCECCQSIYIDARPTENSIGRAYKRYYTHDSDYSKHTNNLTKAVVSVLLALKQGYLNFALGTILTPSIRFPSSLYRVLDKLEILPRIFLQDIHSSKPGKMLDVGCGDGRLMLIAQRYGWETEGIEQDILAVQLARKKGLLVHLGSYQEIVKLQEKYSLIVCSHVIEHVHNPRKLISLMLSILEDDGQIWLQWPNPKSDGLRKFGAYWRGLEAPRHICLPSFNSIKYYVRSKEPAALVINKSHYWKWAQVIMFQASKTLQKRNLPGIAYMNVLSAILEFILARKNIIECELCTVTISKNVIFK